MSNIKNLWMKSPEIVFIFLPAFYWIIWLIKSRKNFEKISILKIWQLFFFWSVKIYFGKLLLKWCIFSHRKISFSQIMPFNQGRRNVFEHGEDRPFWNKPSSFLQNHKTIMSDSEKSSFLWICQHFKFQFQSLKVLGTVVGTPSEKLL